MIIERINTTRIVIHHDGAGHLDHDGVRINFADEAALWELFNIIDKATDRYHAWKMLNGKMFDPRGNRCIVNQFQHICDGDECAILREQDNSWHGVLQWNDELSAWFIMSGDTQVHRIEEDDLEHVYPLDEEEDDEQ